MEDKLVILDLDESLIHTIDPSYETPTFDETKRGIPIQDGRLLTLKRPHVDIFLDYVFKTFKNVAVWTSASEGYAEEILDLLNIDKNLLKFFYTSINCTPRYHYSNYGKEADIVYFKKLNKLSKKGWDLNKVLIIDDNEVVHKHNYGNLLRVKAYYGQPDDELLKVIDYLDVIKFKDNWRKIEKRGWDN